MLVFSLRLPPSSLRASRLQCALPDLHREQPRPVLPAGPQPRASAASVPCRISTAIFRTSTPRSNVRKNVRRYVSKNVRTHFRKNVERMSEEMPERMSQDKSERISDRMSEDMSESMPDRLSGECQKECQTECQKINQKACQTDCQEICQKECQKQCQKICQKECQKIASSQSVKLRVTGRISGDSRVTRSRWHKNLTWLFSNVMVGITLKHAISPTNKIANTRQEQLIPQWAIPKSTARRILNIESEDGVGSI